MKRSILLLVGTACLTFSSLSHSAAVDDRRIIEAERTALLPLRLISDEGVFVVYDAAVPWTERDERARYVGWWLGANDPQAYVYSALVYHSYGAVESLVDLAEQFALDLEPLTADDPALRKRVVRELERREAIRAGEQERPADQSRDGEGADSTGPRSDEATAPPRERQPVPWIPATRDTVLALMGFSPAPDPETDLIGPDVNIVDPCAPPEGCDPVLQFVGATQPRHRGFVSVLRAISEALNLLGGRCDSCIGGGWICLPGPTVLCADDGNPCTVDYRPCSNLSWYCIHPALYDGTSCPDEGNPCTDDVCANGACTHPVWPDCTACEDDGDTCTVDVCSEGVCTNVSNIEGVCTNVSNIPCPDDDNPCTTEDCSNGICEHVPGNNGAACDDGRRCTNHDACSDGVCRGTPLDCNDHNLCTTESPCREEVGCQYQWQDCDDEEPCTIDTCDPQTGACEHHDIRVPVDTCAQIGCNVILTGIPDFLPVNNDDDNRNMIPDGLETGPIQGENDLIQVGMQVSGCTFCAPNGNGYGQFWRFWDLYNVAYYSGDKTGGVAADWWHLAPPPGIVYFEGRLTTGACGAPQVFLVDYCTAYPMECNPSWALPECGCGKRFGTTVVAAVTSLTWEKADPGNADLVVENAECRTNGGVRIFPDKLSPTDYPDPPDLRQQIDLVATVTPPIAGVHVYFQIYDVDDPFDQVHGPLGLNDIANVSLIDGDAVGADNRPVGGTDPAVGFETAVTDQFGIARKTIRVSMQPGNNYRAGASLLLDAVIVQVDRTMADALSVRTDADGKLVANGDFAGYQCPLTWSPMLTVWRKLHVEVDSMGAEDFNQTGSRETTNEEWTRFVVPPPSPTIPAPVQIGVPDVGLTTVLGSRIPWGSPCNSSFDNRWEGGAFALQNGGPQYLIVRNSCHTTSDGQLLTRFIIFGDPGNIIWSTIDIRDDDLYVSGNAPRQLPKTTVLTDDIREAYRDAYIEIVEANSELNPRSIVPWASELSTFWLGWDHDFGTGVCSSWDLASQARFWARLFVFSYQPEVGKDSDPDIHEDCGIGQNCVSGQSPDYHLIWLSPPLSQTMDTDEMDGFTVRNTTLRWTATSTVYVETIRENLTDQFSTQLWQYAAHEIGHSTLDPQGLKAPPGVEHSEGGLMAPGDSMQNLPQWQQFTAPTLLRFRSVSTW